MSTPERGRRATDLFDERLIRLKCFIDNKAPRQITAGSARLLLRAHDGGPVGHILAEIRELVKWAWSWYVQIPTMHTLCRLNIYHMEQGPGGFGCPFCGKGENPEAPPACEIFASVLGDCEEASRVDL